MPVVNPHAAGIDIGSKSHFVSVAQDNIAQFGVFTEDLHQIAQHLQSHEVKTVALESTGFYWRPLFILLQDYGFEVVLVNARHVKNVKGHKTNVFMNIQLGAVLRYITGESGIRVIEAILAGEREAKDLAKLVSSRVKASRQAIEKVLVGDCPGHKHGLAVGGLRAIVMYLYIVHTAAGELFDAAFESVRQAGVIYHSLYRRCFCFGMGLHRRQK